ncbi:UNVERIFIED_CONTAM: protein DETOXIFICATION 40 [Sesamum latifolium]|uniref:Protein DETOXIFICATION 40 n=1 Tax=Sesamum latifolium TaxID=2727402 RepID=A0AAW2WSF0_9LAMI
MAFTGLWDFFKLSAASAVMLFLETWYFQILVLIAGLLPDPEIELDSLTVCSTLYAGLGIFYSHSMLHLLLLLWINAHGQS